MKTSTKFVKNVLVSSWILPLLCSTLTGAAWGDEDPGKHPIVHTDKGGVASAGQGTQNANGGWPLGRDPQAITQTDVGGVYKAGTQGDRFGIKTELAPGFYYVADSEKKDETFGLMVEPDANNPDYVLAMMIPLEVVNERDPHSGRGYFFQGRPIKSGNSIMLAPMGIDMSGNITVSSEMKADAPVVEVKRLPGKANRYPFVLQGRNGALEGRTLLMRGADSEKPYLKNCPSQGFFIAGTRDSLQVSVFGNQVTLNDRRLADNTYQLWSLNGKDGKFSALIDSKLDTMGEQEVTPEQIKKIVTFVSNESGKILGWAHSREVMIVAQPSFEAGEFEMTAYRQAEKSTQDKWFPGRTTPKTHRDGDGNGE